MQRVILHIDFDSFFASVEQQHNPKLRGKPIGVTATNGRTCIIASSREAKRMGIGTGSRTYEARRICPSLILVPADFVKYWEVSKKFVKICDGFSPFIEVFSIDELFIDVTKTTHLFGGVDAITQRIKDRIRTEIGEFITVSIGISHNKLLAKLASGLLKPNGVFAITPQNLDSVYVLAKLTDVCGIGERIKARLNKVGVQTLLDLRSFSKDRLVKEFGNVEAAFLKCIALGIDESPIALYTTAPSVKSVGRNYCLLKNEYDKRIILQNIYELCEEIGIKLRRLHKKARTVGISLRGSIVLRGRETYRSYVDTGKEIYDRCLASQGLALQSWTGKEYMRQISVWVSNLEDASNLPLPLFSFNEKREKLTETVDRINERFGDHTIRNGFLLYADKLTTVPNGYMADRYERSKLAVPDRLPKTIRDRYS